MIPVHYAVCSNYGRWHILSKPLRSIDKPAVADHPTTISESATCPDRLPAQDATLLPYLCSEPYFDRLLAPPALPSQVPDFLSSGTSLVMRRCLRAVDFEPSILCVDCGIFRGMVYPTSFQSTEQLCFETWGAQMHVWEIRG
jgi:hypothetical protein